MTAYTDSAGNLFVLLSAMQQKILMLQHWFTCQDDPDIKMWFILSKDEFKNFSLLQAYTVPAPNPVALTAAAAARYPLLWWRQLGARPTIHTSTT